MENPKPNRSKLDPLPSEFIDGKDELNLAEFPLSSIADRVSSGTKTMVFEDQIWDETRGEMITRKLTISASEKYGLPTALDDEVILGLVQLTKLRNFEEREVQFSRYQLINLLGWRDESKSYERIDKSLKRWMGVTLYYKNAWWSKEEKCWVDEDFHILDNVTLYDRERAKRQKVSGQQNLTLSSFVWNHIIFRSFQSGNLKSLDFEFFKRLKSPISKRIYRFLDKRFYFRSRLDFALKEFAWEHIGLARTYDTSNLKRKLQPALEELESTGFLKKMPAKERFLKICAGECVIVFEKADDRPEERVENHSKMKGPLIERGISVLKAEEIAKTATEQRIVESIEIFDWLREKKDKRVSINPAGFLIASIERGYAVPSGFETEEAKRARLKLEQQKKDELEHQKQRQKATEEAASKNREKAILNYWNVLSDAERNAVESKAMNAAEPLLQKLSHGSGFAAKAAKKTIIDSYILKLLEKQRTP